MTTPQTIEVNARSYRWMQRPVVVVGKAVVIP